MSLLGKYLILVRFAWRWLLLTSLVVMPAILMTARADAEPRVLTILARGDSRQRTDDRASTGIADCISTACNAASTIEVAEQCWTIIPFRGDFTDIDLDNLNIIKFLLDNNGNLVYLKGNFVHYYIDERMRDIERECHDSHYKRLAGFEKFND